MYDYLDKVLKKLVREIYRIFQRYRSLRFDELTAFQNGQELYRELAELNLAAYKEIALYYYEREKGDTDLFVVDAFLAGLLVLPSEVMHYAYESEVIRKRDRLVEAIIATSGSVAEIDKAMRYWVQMTGWFGVEVADAAILSAREDAEVELVIWKSENDSRVCHHCLDLHNRVFRLEDLPPKPHPNCRCWTEVV